MNKHNRNLNIRIAANTLFYLILIVGIFNYFGAIVGLATILVSSVSYDLLYDLQKRRIQELKERITLLEKFLKIYW
jgi:hypothetical protein